MKKNASIFTTIACFILLLQSLIFSQTIILDPVAVTFHQSQPPTIFDANEPVQVKVISDAEWQITCTAEPLLHEGGIASIPPERILLKHALSGEAYIPMNNSIEIGNGGSTNGEEALINTLNFQIESLVGDATGNYFGIVRFFSGALPIAELSLNFTIDKNLDFHLSAYSVNFDINGAPGIYDGDIPIDVSVESNTTEWHLEASITAASASADFSGENVYLKSSTSEYNIDEGAGIGFQPLAHHPIVLSGDQSGQTSNCQIEFRIMTSWNIESNNYSVTVELKIPEFDYTEYIDLNIMVREYNIFSLSESNVHFHANGPPAIWDGDRSAIVTVGSNCSQWSIVCEASNLRSENDEIPNSRIFLKINPDDFTGDYGAGVGFYKLDTPQLEIANGTVMSPSEICELNFRLKTLDIDRPGHYEGMVTFTFLANP